MINFSIYSVKNYLLLILLCIASGAVNLYGQGVSHASFSAREKDELKRLYIGDKMPASVWKNIPKKKTTELLILDFWSTGCTSCMEAFPKMEKLQHQFDEKLQVVLLNPWESEHQVKERMDKMNVGRVKNELEPYTMLASLPAITGDTVYKILFPARSVPHHVWVSGTGEVLAITHGYNATPEHVQAMLEGKKLNMLLKDDLPGKELLEKGYIQPTLENMPPVYYSAFIPYFSAGASASNRVDSAKGTFRTTYYNDGMIDLFRTAFRDKEYKKRERMVLELKDKEKYQYPRKDKNLIDDYLRNYTFTYDIQGPLKDRNNWQEKMQHDVNDFFGSKFGVEGFMEKRQFNAWILVKTKDGLLPVTKSGEQKYRSKDDLFIMVNYPFSELVNAVTWRFEDMDAGRPFIDETNVDPKLKVDMQLTGDLKDIENVRKQLNQYGLDIIEGKRELEVLVIRDKKK